MQVKKNQYVYQIVTADRFETVIAQGDTLEELAKVTCLKKSALSMALERKSVVAGNFKIIKVSIKDYDFNFADYLDFCKTDNLNPKSAKSLQRFKEYCGEAYDL